jgi:serine/threonine protein phosphatase PrpC
MESIVRYDRIFGMTLTGQRDQNEDALLAEPLADAVLLAVADGVGGYAAGEVAAATAIETLRHTVTARYHRGMGAGAVLRLLEDAFFRAHEMITGQATGARAGMATTLVAAVVRGQHAMIANCGDSRAYLLGESMLFRTADHSPVQSLLDSGAINEDEARTHPMHNIITHALGGELRVDLYERRLQAGDVVLLSTDGLHDAVTEAEIRESRSRGAAETVVRPLVENALRRSSDNITIIALIV